MLSLVLSLCRLAQAQQQIQPIADESEVEVEERTNKTSNKVCNCIYTSDVPYSERRSRWGGFFGVQAGMFEPVNYQPDFQPNEDFDSLYGGNKTPIVEVAFGFKLNFVLGSLGTQFTAGYFSRTEEVTPGTSTTLVAQPITGALFFQLDNLFKEPYVVPYGMGGISSVIYSEKAGGLSVSGNSAFAPFWAGGLLFQMDWLDSDADYAGYEEFGLENTFLYVEARSFLTALSDRGPDFSTPVQLGGGLKVEF